MDKLLFSTSVSASVFQQGLGSSCLLGFCEARKRIHLLAQTVQPTEALVRGRHGRIILRALRRGLLWDAGLQGQLLLKEQCELGGPWPGGHRVMGGLLWVEGGFGAEAGRRHGGARGAGAGPEAGVGGPGSDEPGGRAQSHPRPSRLC